MQYLKPNVKYLKRDVDDYFRNWKSDEWHHALIAIGARQVGKTTSILHFAEFLGCLGYRDKYNSCEIDKLTENQDAWFRNVFEIYCKVGGYPSAVQAYLQNKDYEKALTQSRTWSNCTNTFIWWC